VDEIDKLKQAMAAAVRRLGDRPNLVRVAEDPASLGLTPDDLRAFEQSIRDALAWIRQRTNQADDPVIELLAVASALGLIAAWDHGTRLQLTLLLAYRLISAAEQMKESK